MTEGSREREDPGETGDDGSSSESRVTDVDDVVGGEDSETAEEEAAEIPDPTGQSVSVSVETEATGRQGDQYDDREEVTADPDRATDRRGTTDRSEADLERELLGPEERIGPRQQYCNDCGAVFSVETEQCPDCGNPFPTTSDPPASSRKVPRLAAALSMLLPGAGQLYNEQFGKATLAFFGTVFLVSSIAFVGLVMNVLVSVASLFTLSAVGTVIMILAILFGWFLPVSIAAWDAYDQARKLNATR